MKINIDGQDYELDVKTALEKKCLAPIHKHEVGNFYRYDNGTNKGVYHLVKVDNIIGLVDIKDGIAYSNGIIIRGRKIITESEWRDIACIGDLCYFTPMEAPKFN